jgi:hypothetical protein
MKQNTKVDIPAWLEESPTGITDLPVQSNIQDLPFEKLTWENFERLCLRLIREEADVENCRPYGTRGDKQEGIDIYAVLKDSGKYNVYQCKREKDFFPTKIKKAVDKFLAGTWVQKTSAFILCTQESLSSKQRSDAIISQIEKLRQIGISFIPWDSEELSIKLKDHPKIVADFFNEHFAKAFCVEAQIEKSNDSIKEAKCIEKYNKWIADRTSYFQLPGLCEHFSMETDWIPRKVKILHDHSKPFAVELVSELEILKLSILIGDSGVGKKTIVRRLANNLINTGVRILLIDLPDILSLLKNGKTFNEAVLEVSIDGLSSNKNLLLSALNNPDYLLADGLDKCGSDDRTMIAEKINTWVIGHSNTRVLLTSRSSHEVELPSNWVHLEVQPLRKEHIREFTINALNKLSTGNPKFDEKSMLIKEITFSEIDLNLIGFIISLTGSDIDISKMNRAEIYKLVIYDANYYRQQPKESISTIKKILEMIAWKSIKTNQSFPEEKLLEELIKKLRLMGYFLSEAEKSAENGIEFWENKCILNRSNSRVDFVHSSICAYAAGQYAIKLSDADFQSWIKKAIHNTEWKESVSFACGLGAGEKVIKHLLSLDELNLVTLYIATSAITESKELSVDLLENIVNKIYFLLESDSPLTIIKATDALLSILPKAHQIIANATKIPLTNISLWNRLAVMKIMLACDEENVDLDILLDLIKEAFSSITRPSLLISENPRVISFVPSILGNKWKYWGAKNQIIFDGCELLLKKRKEIKTVDSILDLFTGDSLDEITKISIGNALSPIFREMLDDTISFKNRSVWLPPFLRYLNVVINPKLQEFSSPQYWNRQIRELKRVERDRSSDKAFLASVLRVVEQTDENSFVEYPVTSLSSLGTLHSGMGWEEISIEEWHTFDQIDTEVCDAVLKCMITVLGINQKKLRLEVLQEWKHVNDFFVSKLPPIKKILQNSTITSEHFRVSKYIQDEIILSSMSYRIPLVPINYNWKLIEDIKICPEILSHALKYPSQGIYCSAVLLIMNGVGGRESLDLAKKIVGEDKWNTFLKS